MCGFPLRVVKSIPYKDTKFVILSLRIKRKIAVRIARNSATIVILRERSDRRISFGD